jgi:hypothetical protein
MIRDPDYPLPAYCFLWALFTAAGASAIAILRTRGIESFSLPATALWSLLAVLIESVSVHNEEGNIYVSPVEAVFYGGYLCCGARAALIIVLLTYLLRLPGESGRIRHVLRIPFRLTLFNICHFILIIFLLDLIYRPLSERVGFPVAALLLAPFIFLLSCVFNAYFYKVEEGRPFSAYVREILNPYLADALPPCFAAVLIAGLYPRFGLTALLFFFTPLLVSLIFILGREEKA